MMVMVEFRRDAFNHYRAVGSALATRCPDQFSRTTAVE